MTQHVDFFNRPLALDDTVITFDSTSRPIVYGKVVKITPKNVRVEYQGDSYGFRPVTLTTLRKPNQVVKVPIDGQELMIYHLTK